MRQYRTRFNAAALRSDDAGIDVMVRRHLEAAGVETPAVLVVVEPCATGRGIELDLTTYTEFDERYSARSTIRGSLKLLAARLGMRL